MTDKPNKLRAVDIELAVSAHFGVRANLIVPNVSWGLRVHECDLLILSKAGYATEVEIKVTKYDLIKDKDKKHAHVNVKIAALYFAIPDYLENCIEHVPEHAGIITVGQKQMIRRYGTHGPLVEFTDVAVLRKPRPHYNYKFSDKERYKLARLGAMRIWGLKKKIVKLQSSVNDPM
jgi:hypothetical protein